jgi:hypothetical protein
LQDATAPGWSPDGKQVVFTYWDATGAPRFRVVRTSSRPGGGVRTIHAGKGEPFGSSAWLAGGRIIFQVNTTLYSVAVHGGKPKPIAFPSCGSPNYLQCGPEAFILSPTREYAAVTTDDGEGNPPPPELIALLKLKPGHVPVELQTPINAEEQGGGYSDVILSFSPHGRQLVFRRDAADCPLPPIPPCSTPPGTGLMAFRLGGGAPVPLAQSGLPGASLVPSDAQRVQWSPDGRWVAFVEHQSLEAVPTTGASAPRVLATNFDSFAVPVNDFSWSPTSKLIAYDCCFNQATRQFMTVRADGTHLTDLLKGRPLTEISETGGWAPSAGGPQWSPDGSRLLFLAQTLGHRSLHVWTIRPNGHDLTRLG